MQELPGLAGRLFGGGGAVANADGLHNSRHGDGTAARQEASAAAEVRCPRCDSANTKFCYYNNYNLAQPRHFCRACRRYWTKGGHLRNVPVGGGCRKPKPRRHAPAADGVHAAGRDGKAPRSGCAGAGAGPAADGDAPVSRAFSAAAVTEPSGTINGSVAEATAGAGILATGDARAPLVPPPEPMFADQAPVFASLFAPPRPLPAFSCSAQPKAGEHVASLLAEQQPPSSAAAGTAPPSCAGAPDWTTASPDEGVFELAGGIAGDASWTAYWNPGGSWTDPDPTIYLP